MARSNRDADAGAEATDDYTSHYVTGTLPVEDDMEGRDRKAHAEHMVVLPQFDKWGEAFETYEVTTESGNTYEVEANGRGNCPDANFNSPEGGCKHRRRLINRLNSGEMTPPGHDVTDYLTETVPLLVDAFADELGRLREGRQATEDAGGNAAPFEESIEEVKTFITTLADGYAEYRERVDESAPALRETLVTDTDLHGLLNEDSTTTDE